MIKRVIEMIFYGALIEILASVVLCYAFQQASVLHHLETVYQRNDQYLDSSYLLSLYVVQPFDHYILMPIVYGLKWLTQATNGHTGLLGMIFQYLSWFLVIFTGAIALFLQKCLIALISLPIFFAFILVGFWDGVIHRELRRYRVGIESTKREKFDKAVKVSSRVALIGYVTIPLYIPAPIWFAFWGIGTAILVQIATSYYQKYI